ncbi:antibiotic biosynthesis monooxygenase family protein [Streptomyces mexicanus]|uniref:antibiotic biosynthesis monooxygenase family protein n=1 Tax=Streptomyces mexicanus TaxID=178566 RepID=UPI00364AE746
MVTEIAIIDVLPGHEAAFAAAFQKTGHQLLATTPGCISVKMYRSSENPSRFTGVNEWESEKAHLENFRGSDRYIKYGEVLRPHLAVTPLVQHFDDVLDN